MTTTSPSVEQHTPSGTARLLPGAPVAEAVLAETARRGHPPARPRHHTEPRHHPGRRRRRQRRLHPHQAAPGRRARVRLPARAPARRPPPRPTCTRPSPGSTPTRPCTGCSCSTRCRGTWTTTRRCRRIDPDKDVDGMHPLNMGRLAVGLPGPLPCTPAGIEALLAHYEIPVAGREVVILGRGATLGRPLAMLLAQKRPTANAAVTVVHTGVPDWARYTRRADILVAAAGVPGHHPARARQARRRRHRRRRPLRGPAAPARRRRSVRRGRRRDHAAGRRGRPDHRRDAVPQRRPRRRASGWLGPRERRQADMVRTGTLPGGGIS